MGISQSCDQESNLTKGRKKKEKKMEISQNCNQESNLTKNGNITKL